MRQGTLKSKQPETGVVGTAIRRCSGIFIGVALFSGLVNILALTGSFYMLQVYDRVLSSRSVPTLVGLTVLMALLYVCYGLLDFFRSRLMNRAGMIIDRQLSDRVFAAVQLLPLRARSAGDGMQPVRDLDQIRSFMSGLGPTALFDMPWVPIYLAFVYFLHPTLGLFATFGAVVLVCLTLLTEMRSSGPLKDATRTGAQRNALGESARRNAEAIRAMGLGPKIGERWSEINVRYLDQQAAASDAVTGIGSAGKILRLLLQSGTLGLGAYLVIHGEVSAGTIIASSITTTRALAPIELAIAHWRGFASARQSYGRLVELFKAQEQMEPKVMSLPAPHKSIVVERLAVAPPGAMKPTIQGVSFSLAAGDGLGVIGPSASGKSTLARTLVGAWMPIRMSGGAVRIDGASLDQWPPHELGRHLGYLPQDIELFDGTVADNIARFDDEATSEAIVAAATAAGVHEMIVHLSDGYQTRIGEGGTSLSAGQRQRVALARALYGDPFLVVLEEPNSNLDATGDAALTEAIRSVRVRGGIIIVIAHRPSALSGVDKVLAMANGQMQAFGPKEEVLRKILQPVPASNQAAPQRLAMTPPPLPALRQSGSSA